MSGRISPILRYIARKMLLLLIRLSLGFVQCKSKPYSVRTVQYIYRNPSIRPRFFLPQATNVKCLKLPGEVALARRAPTLEGVRGRAS